MALFEVPGWPVPTAVSNAIPQETKKRKRSSRNDPESIHSAQMNLEKLVKRLKDDNQVDRHTRKRRERKIHDKKDNDQAARGQSDEKSTEKATSTSNSPVAKFRSSSTRESSISTGPFSRKRVGANQTSKSQLSTAVGRATSNTSGLTPLQKGLKQNLDGARFRWINEMLYKTNSAEAHKMMQDDPKVYEEYHAGFRLQVHTWPSNPVSHYISKLSSYPQKSVIADLGCGDAALARALIPKGMTVLSFDLVADGAFVVEADVCGELPLPGSEGAEEGHVVDVVICSLSLMGTNWVNCIREAWRILKPGGELHVAEVASRLKDVEEFIALINTIGFRHASKDDKNTHFTLFEWKKVSRKAKTEAEWARLSASHGVLKPCEYKRR